MGRYKFTFIRVKEQEEESIKWRKVREVIANIAVKNNAPPTVKSFCFFIFYVSFINVTIGMI